MVFDDLFSLQGKRVLVTGASGFLGQHMAYAVAKAGAHVLVNARDRGKAEKIVENLQEEKFSAELFVFDVSKELQVKKAGKSIGALPLHALINNAYYGDAGTIANAEGCQYVDSYSISVVAVHNIFNAFLPSLKLGVQDDGQASVINVASMYGMVSPDLRIYDKRESANPPFYGAAKAALIQWSRYAACEFGPLGIRVNSISPGPFPNNSVQQNMPAFVRCLADRVPMGRIGNPEEIQGPVVFLASSASTYVNGANLVVDGGWTAW